MEIMLYFVTFLAPTFTIFLPSVPAVSAHAGWRRKEKVRAPLRAKDKTFTAERRGRHAQPVISQYFTNAENTLPLARKDKTITA